MPPIASPTLLSSLSAWGGSLMFALDTGDDKQGPNNSTKPRANNADAEVIPPSCSCTSSFCAAPHDVFSSRLQRDVNFFRAVLLRETNSSVSASSSSHHTPGQADTATAIGAASSLDLLGEVDIVALASRLFSVGYKVHVRRAVGGGASSSTCFQNLRHEFLLVKGDGSQGSVKSVDYVVDPRFREQFAIPHPTPEYAALLAKLPATFIGPFARLQPIVQVMCAEMAESFKAWDLELPPWRKTQSVLSKWMATNVQDVAFDQTVAADQPQAALSLSKPRTLQRSSGGFGSSACGPVVRSQQLAQHIVKIGFAV